jgi:hypothetical protein
LVLFSLRGWSSAIRVSIIMGRSNRNAFDVRREVTASVPDVGNLPEARLAGYWPVTRPDV